MPFQQRPRNKSSPIKTTKGPQTRRTLNPTVTCPRHRTTRPSFQKRLDQTAEATCPRHAVTRVASLRNASPGALLCHASPPCPSARVAFEGGSQNVRRGFYCVPRSHPCCCVFPCFPCCAVVILAIAGDPESMHGRPPLRQSPSSATAAGPPLRETPL